MDLWYFWLEITITLLIALLETNHDMNNISHTTIMGAQLSKIVCLLLQYSNGSALVRRGSVPDLSTVAYGQDNPALAVTLVSSIFYL